jgi:large subunit ribosomal protein L13
MKTYSAKPADIKRQWHLLDASKLPLGRLSVIAAGLLLGKSKPTITPHMDGGDFVVIINAKELVVTGNKRLQKSYYRHSGYPGGLRERRLEEQLTRDPSKVIEHAIRGMLPVNKLRAGRLARLKIYEEDQHEHQAQKPIEYKLDKAGK